MLEIFEDLLNNGGPMIIPLMVCSVIVMTVIVERCFFWLSKKMRQDKVFSESLCALVKKGDVKDVLSGLGKSRDVALQVIHEGLKVPSESFEEAVEVAAKKMMVEMNRSLGLLDTMVTMAPLLGILGTVLGIIDSFDLLGDHGLKDPSLVTKGISEALISTAAGLIVALMALLPVNYFRHQTRKLLRKIEVLGGELHIILQNRDGKYGA